MLPAFAIVGGALTVTVGVVANNALQPDAIELVAKTLKVVVAVRFPVGNKIVPPLPANADPTNALLALFLNW